MKKFYVSTIVILFCSVNFTFAEFDLPAIQNKGFSINTHLFSENSLPMRSSTLKLFTKTKERRRSDAFEEGAIVVTAGYGFPNLGKILLKTYRDNEEYKVTGFGPLSFKGEYGLSDRISLGLSINYVSFKATWIEEGYNANNMPVPYTYSLSRTSLSMLARMNLHFATSEKLDPYWGIGVGYILGNYKYDTNNPYDTDQIDIPTFPVGLETTLGLRYYITDNIGIYMEMGFSKALLQGGIAFKF